MIRINLLGIKKEVTKSRMPSVSMEGAKATALFVIIIVVAVVALGAHYTMLSQESSNLSQQISKEKAEKARLEKIKSEFDQFEKRRQLLSKRIDIIETLRKNQAGPVVLLNTLASTVQQSGNLWLTAFQNDGTKISMDGMAISVNTVADFITNLKNSGQFKNVEIKDTYEDVNNKELSIFIFSLSAEIVPLGPAPAPAAAPGGKA